MSDLLLFTEFEELKELLPEQTWAPAPGEGVLFFGPASARARCNEVGGFFVLTGKGLSLSQIRDSKVRHKDFACYEWEQEPKERLFCFNLLLRQARRRWELQKLKSHLIRENQELQDARDREGLKRRQWEEGRQQKSLALKKASAQLRKRIFFLKRLNEAMDLKDVVAMVHEEARKVRGLGDALMAVFKDHQARILYTSGRAVLEKRLSQIPPLQSPAQWRQTLADHLNRPIGPLIFLEGSKSGFGLFFEHHLTAEALQEVVDEWKLRRVGLELAVDRFQLAQDLEEAALFWEKTFDGLGEPIGIFDGDHQVIRANQLFSTDLMNHLEDRLVRDEGKTFQVESYALQTGREVARGAKVIHLTDQTSSFQLKQHIIQTEKIAALGQLAGHIAHELNNPLTGIRSLCQLLEKDLTLDEQMRQDIHAVEEATARCQNIIRNLLEYSKPHGEDQRVKADVNEVISNTLPLLKSLMGRHRRQVSLSEKPLTALVDPHMLQQVIFNLIANACQAMSDGGGETGEISVTTELQDGKIHIRIQDTGPGIPAALVREIFEPFFTTKPVGQGTGLGLSLSLNIIRGFGGEIQVDESYQNGAAFVITLSQVS